MTSSANIFYTIFIFLCLAHLIFIYEVEAKICRASKNTKLTYGCSPYSCHVDCISREHADYGACMPRDMFFLQCLCYFTC
ncbi:unnamed protein product [Trifolium pratense]|uniref:Uncharacterized protein n=1 Tax=Trifolium pratense TaxID=57577 RepID=A0ACB0ISW7_TRIPR|nr:unnamed protein product [Trifolium pratense]